MDFIYLKTFRQVALRQSFTRAAEELGYAQSSVTTQIQKLEKEYNVKLFERHGKTLRLTSSGEELLKIAVQIIELYDQSKEKLAMQGGGTLSIGTIDSIASYFLPQVIQTIRESYPEMNIRLQADREDYILDQVKEGEFDIGLILGNTLPEPTLNTIVIREEPLVLVSSPKNPLLQLNQLEINDLKHTDWFMAEASCNYRIMLEKVLRAHGIPFNVRLELGNPEAIKRCVMAGDGIALLPEMVVRDEIQRQELSVLPFAHSDIKLYMYLVIHPKKWISNSLMEFISLLKPDQELISL